MKKNENKKACLRLLLFLLMFCSQLTGCTLVHFDDPAESQQQTQEIEKQTTVEYPDAAAALAADRLVMDEKLTDDTGRVLAVYQAAFPWFTAGSSQALQNINAHYENEFSYLAEDQARFFELVRQKPSDTVRTAIFTYELLEAPEGYIAVLRRYESVDTLDISTVTYYCEVFSAATGLQLRFSNLFGNQSAAAMEALRSALADWCAQREYDTGWAEALSDDVLTENITLDQETLYVGLPAGAAPGGETLAELPVEPFLDLLGGGE